MHQVSAHLIKKMINAPIVSVPFPYFFIKQIFPDTFYQELIHHLPDSSLYDYSDSNYRRWTLTLNAQKLHRLPESQKHFWERLCEEVYGDLFIDAILKAFKSHIKERFGESFERRNVYGLAELIQDTSNYSINPHTDHPDKIVTLLFYFPTSDDFVHIGTSIYRPKNPQFKCAGKYRYPFEDFDKVWQAPFLPNSLFGFFKTDDSFHGVEPTGDHEKDRNLMAYTLWNRV